MTDELTSGVVDYYTGRFVEHGTSHAGVDWNSRESQELRFDQLLRAAGTITKSINDFGCGYGALRTHLDRLGTPLDYRGFDLSEPMIASARTTFEGRSDTMFVSAFDDLEPADVTIASGLFNIKLDASDEHWSSYVLETIDAIASVSLQAFSFNMLTSWSDADRMRPDLHYADPCAMFEHCKRTYSRQVALLHDYGLYEFTILVRMES